MRVPSFQGRPNHHHVTMPPERQGRNQPNWNDAAGRARQFAVVWHETPPGDPTPSHWDLFLEHESVLWTWRLTSWPSLGLPAPAERIADHRLQYLEYSGPLSRNRGAVRQVDSGSWRLTQGSEGEIRGELCGTRLQGELHLVKLDLCNSWSLEIIPKRSSESVSSS